MTSPRFMHCGQEPLQEPQPLDTEPDDHDQCDQCLLPTVLFPDKAKLQFDCNGVIGGYAAFLDAPVPSEFTEEDPSELPTAGAAGTLQAPLEARIDVWMQRMETKLDALMQQVRAPMHVNGPSKVHLDGGGLDSTSSDVYKEWRKARQSRHSAIIDQVTASRTSIMSRRFSKLSGQSPLVELEEETDDNSSRSNCERNETAGRGQNSQKISEALSEVYKRAKRLTKQPRREPPPTFWQTIVRGKVFASAVVLVVLLNTVLIGVQTQMDADGRNHGVTRTVLDAAGHACSTFYAIELGFRLGVEPLHKHFERDNRGWFAMDCMLVVLCGLEIGLQLASKSIGLNQAINAGRMIRALKLVKITRVVKMFRFLTQLRVMVAMILTSLSSLFWLFVLLFLMVYVCAVVLTQGITDYVIDGGKVEPNPNVEPSGALKFGGVLTSMETLFAITTGAEWSEEGFTLRTVNGGLYTVLVLYVFFSFFSVLNIVNGVFVDSAIRYSKQDRDLVADQKAQDKQVARALYLTQFRAILAEMDANEDNIISAQEFRDGLKHHGVLELLESLEVDPDHAEELFELLDVDGNGEVTVDEFVDGILKLRSETTPFDMHLLLYQNRKLLRRLENT